MTTQTTIETTIEEMIVHQEKVLFDCGRRLIPTLTTEDILQPHDYPLLELNPHFRYEEGVLSGLMTVHAALKAQKMDRLHYNPGDDNESN